jgi:thioredoxin 1
MNFQEIQSIDEFNEILQQKDAVLSYFSHEQCNVCKVLKPKIAEMINKNYPKIDLIYANTVKNPEIAGQFSVFTVPTIIAFFGGREQFRKSRSIGVDELNEQIERPYSMIFGD